MVIVIDKVTEGQKAKDFADLPKLKENMKKAGVIGVPVVSFADVVRNDDAKIELKDRLMVIHKVAVSDMEKAKARIASEDLKKIMTDAGVEGVPFFYYRLVDQGKPG